MEAQSECAATLSTATAENTLKMSTMMLRHSGRCTKDVTITYVVFLPKVSNCNLNKPLELTGNLGKYRRFEYKLKDTTKTVNSNVGHSVRKPRWVSSKVNVGGQEKTTWTVLE